jgi:hypothetical protein
MCRSRVDGFVKGAIAIQSHPHESAGFDVAILDAAFAEGLLLVVTVLTGAGLIEQRTAVAVRAVAVGVSELVGRVHAQALWAARHSVGVAYKDGMSMLVPNPELRASFGPWIRSLLCGP